MRVLKLLQAMPMVLTAFLVAVSCFSKEPEPVSQPAATAPAPGAAATATTAADTAVADNNAGATVYNTYCVTCHGTKGKGDGVAAAALNPKPADFAIGAFKYDADGNGAPGDIDDIKAVVHDGAAKHGGSSLMAPWPMLSPEQLQAVAEHLKSLHSG